MSFLRELYHILSSIKKIVPYKIRLRTDAETFHILNFMKLSSKLIKKNELLLDAGAGTSPYKDYFNHARYESCDFEDIFDPLGKDIHTFTCDLEKIPKKNNTYDAILNTQVLEHVENPQNVMDEFYRVLKPGGKLFLTVPQGWGVHGAPYHFFNFTNFGLTSVFKKSGFQIKFIKEKGGYFHYLGYRIKTFPFYIISQYLLKINKNKEMEFKPTILGILLLPFYLVLIPFTSFLIPLLFFYVDKLDKKKNYTLGYICYCIKPKKR